MAPSRSQKGEAFNPTIPAGYWTPGGFVYLNNNYILINGTHSDTMSEPFNHIVITMNAGDDVVEINDVTVPWDTSVYLGPIPINSKSAIRLSAMHRYGA